ncbi:L-lactate dehydrogenase complex protein LldG [Desulfuromusa kysingii]|uniref:L-lactate dehydrogenase complex protein LldG n=1 Tax=Desulfuromusa kysingii TaxID=37625 RepID=A0A1H3XI10_9BACT|nr:lactate utilization protein [Desulfuromusa kysingii]SDZ98953.1 L-lactate dehydrogenase complex protein LldG [Desulfuromusa kysingii]
MLPTQLVSQFTQAAINSGAEVIAVKSIGDAAEYIATQITGVLLVPPFLTAGRFKLKSALKKTGISIEVDNFRTAAIQAEAGITGVNFAIADTGTLVLESTHEDVRLATTLPPKQFALLDPEKIVADGLQAVKPLRQLHQRNPRNYIAYVTGPSRTADIERVLTIGAHGPKQLFILLVPGFSNDYLEM